MDYLPQELIDRVAQLLDPDDLENVLVLSLKFQHAAERASGRFTCFAFKEHSVEECQNFTAIFGNHRFRYLRRIEVYTKYTALEPRSRARSCRQKRKNRDPSPEPEPVSCRESEQELQQKDDMFTDQVARCFEAIKAVETSGSGGFGRLQLVVFTPTQQVHECYCNHRRYSSWRVHLLCPEMLPELHSVHGLSVCNPEMDCHVSKSTQSRIDLRVIVDLASRCPNLEYLRCKVGADEWTNRADEALEHYKHNHRGPSRDTRDEFSRAVCDIKLPASLQQVQLDFINDISSATSEQCRTPPNLVEPNTHDTFSSSLSLLSTNLTKLELRVMADKTLFWPHDGATTPTWPNLESLNVMFHIAAPSGSWYFQGPPEAKVFEKYSSPQHEPEYPPLQDSEEDGWHDRDSHPEQNVPTFRVIPVDQTILPFLASFARAAANMPKLIEAMLWAPLSLQTDVETGHDSDDSGDEPENESGADNNQIDRSAFALYPDDSLAWGIAYIAPGQLAFDGGESDSSGRQLWWRVGHWRPGQELRELFRRIGQAQWGPQVIEHWTDSRYGDGLVAREWFSEESVFTFRNAALGAFV
ncbi:hypothetical protein OPT61_g2644 [Boeremia exigua]|uniref:Uncharacterized protein n=1 Tax=Boeremia exigua TaxID=749465 RepID=A0ACC2IKR2_9PLEO|nr:hypothetical protein OPT61_g2644 [Boeremia exigua]